MKNNLIVVPCLNHWAFTHMCLQSLISTTDKNRDEILVWNNGSDDETTHYLNTMYKGYINNIYSKTNIGVYPAINRVISKYLGKRNLIIVANDHIVYPGWIESLMSGEEKYGPGVYSPMTIDTGVTPTLRKYQFRRNSLRTKYFDGKPECENPSTILWYLRELYHPHGPEHFRKTVCSEAESSGAKGWPWAGLNLTSNKIIKTVGYFDERLKTHEGHDVDYFRRVNAYGYPCRLLTTDYSHHFGSITLRKAGCGYTDLKQQSYKGQLDESGVWEQLKINNKNIADGINQYMVNGKIITKEIRKKK